MKMHVLLFFYPEVIPSGQKLHLQFNCRVIVGGGASIPRKNNKRKPREETETNDDNSDAEDNKSRNKSSNNHHKSNNKNHKNKNTNKINKKKKDKDDDDGCEDDVFVIEPTSTLLPVPTTTTTTTTTTTLFGWDSTFNVTNCGYWLSSDRTVIKAGPQVQGTSMPVLISDRPFVAGSGVFRWRVKWMKGSTYNCAGIVSEAERQDVTTLRTFGKFFPSVPWLEKTGCIQETEVVVVLDTNARKITVNGKTFENVPKKVYAAICFKMPNEIEARLLFDV